MKNKKIKCKTEYPFCDVGGHGRFKSGDVAEFPENVASSLLKSAEWVEIDKAPVVEEKKEPASKKGGKE